MDKQHTKAGLCVNLTQEGVHHMPICHKRCKFGYACYEYSISIRQIHTDTSDAYIKNIVRYLSIVSLVMKVSAPSNGLPQQTSVPSS